MECLINRSLTSLSPGQLFSTPPVIKFRTSAELCPQCNTSLRVLKTQTKTVYSKLIGKFIAHHTLLHCSHCDNSTVYRSEEIHRIVPGGSSYAYDVIVHIGRAMFQRYQNIVEIQQELKHRAIDISLSEINFLAKKFVIYLSVAHKNVTEQIKDFFLTQGGYILHLDGTTQGSSPHLISTIDQLSKFVLGNIKITSEKSDLIKPLLSDLNKNYGNPLAIVTDMGAPMLLAVKEVFPGVKNFICHFHFLRDIGNDLLKNQYTLLRNSLKSHGITTALQYRKRELKKTNFEEYENKIQQIINTSNSSVELDELTANSICYTIIVWILDGKNQGSAYGFPFDRVLLVFYQRIISAYQNLKLLVQNFSTTEQQKAAKNLKKLILALELPATDQKLAETVSILEENINVFDDLRQALRIALPDTKDGLNDQGMEVEMKTIEEDVAKFTQKIKKQENYQQNKDLQKMVEQIQKYNQKLFADPITVETPDGNIEIQPQRTNNIMEQFFRKFKRNHRRTSGDDAMNKKLQAMLADTLLIKNLDNKEYMKILLRDKPSLEQLFAEIETKQIKQELDKINMERDKIPTKIKALIKQNNLWKVLNLHQ